MPYKSFTAANWLLGVPLIVFASINSRGSHIAHAMPGNGLWVFVLAVYLVTAFGFKNRIVVLFTTPNQLVTTPVTTNT